MINNRFNWDKAVIITFEDGSVKVVPTVEYYNEDKNVKDSKCDKLIPIEFEMGHSGFKIYYL